MTNIGYACIALGVPFSAQETIQLKYLTANKLHLIIENNLNALENIIDYNKENNIFLFRVSSDLIPFGSSSHNNLNWQTIFQEKFYKISRKIAHYGITLSMHPGQYTALNSPHEKVVNNSIKDLEYHLQFLNLLNNGKPNKIILHIGGVYGDKKKSMQRFITHFNNLNENIRKSIVIENDDKFYNIEDVLDISEKTGIPVALDILHHKLNPPINNNIDINYWLGKCKNTFKEGVKQKIHFSQQNKKARKGSHSHTIDAENFLEFYHILQDKDLDIMLEVKDKNLSAIKCLNLISPKKDIKFLKKEWERYKYKILEIDQTDYQKIECLLDCSSYPVIEFYNIIDYALLKPAKKTCQINAALRIWNYFEGKATQEQKETFFSKLNKFKKGVFGINPIKKLLFKYALLYNDKYLLYSYYFYL